MPSDFNNSSKRRLLPLAAIKPTGGTQSIRDISSDYWFGPLQPVRPVAPSTYRPRQYGYTPGANLGWTPKGEDPISFEVLRALADSWDLLRIAIGIQLDRLCKTKFEVRVKRQAGEYKKDQKVRNSKDRTVQELNEFLASPDGFHDFPVWLRMILEDIIVIDAAALYFERDQSGKIASVHPIAGETINRLLTDQGFTPPPPSVAYQQVVYGSPACDLTTDDLLYYMRNERTWKRYGYSPVEQILMTISIALRRQESQLQEYTSGNMPEAFFMMPPDVPLERVKEVQDWFDSILAGNIGERKRVRFMPGYGSADGKTTSSVVFTKQNLLNDHGSLDTWLAQLVCAQIGISAQPFLRMMNRATAAQAQETSEQEGQEPYLLSVESILNTIVQRKMGFVGYEVARQEGRATDVLKQAQADDKLCGKVLTTNELREMRGEDPIDMPEANMLGSWTQQGFIPLGQIQDLGPGTFSTERGGGKDKPKPNGKPNGKDKSQSKGKPNGADKILKTSRHGLLPRIQAGVLTHSSQDAKAHIKKVLLDRFKQLRAKTGKKVHQFIKLSKATDSDPLAQLQQAMMEIMAAEMLDVPEAVEPAFTQAALSGLSQGILQIDVNDTDLIAEANDVARAWASERAAELVGMKWDADGNLIPNPDAQWAITDTTRQKLQQAIEDAFSEPTTADELLTAIEDSGIFSEARAELIARSEIGRAQAQGNLEIWKASGMVEEVEWLLSGDHDKDDECDEGASEGPYSIDDLPDFPPHPGCECILAAATLSEPS